MRIPVIIFALIICNYLINTTYEVTQLTTPKPETDLRYVPEIGRPVDHYDYDNHQWVYSDQVTKTTYRGQLPGRVKKDPSDIVDQLKQIHIYIIEENNPDYDFANPY
jgi:hypothetical protein